MFDEDDLLPVSALQHLIFCERQWGLIHLENIWDENRLTVEGSHLHNRVDETETESRGNVRVARGLRIRSLRLGLTGKADAVEFHRISGVTEQPDQNTKGIRLNDAEGFWQSFPVEFKRGRPKPDRCDTVQLCAQALCLEEMLGASIPAGAIFYGKPRRRLQVAFDASLRSETERTAERLHELNGKGLTPKAKYQDKCRSCSLLNSCMPKTVGRNVREWFISAIEENTDAKEENETAS